MGNCFLWHLTTPPAWEEMACQLFKPSKFGGVYLPPYEKITAVSYELKREQGRVSVFFRIFAPENSASSGKWVLPPVVTTQNLVVFFSYFVTSLLLNKIYDYANT